MCDAEFSDHVMFCSSTGNQTINLIPALQLGIKSTVIISTDYTELKGLTKRLIAAMAARNIPVEQPIIIDKSVEKNINLLTNKLIDSSKAYDKVVWNISGGQKIPTVALHAAFQERINDGHSSDIILYVEGNDPAIWYYGKDFKTESIRSNVALKLDELLMLFNSTKHDAIEIYPTTTSDVKSKLKVGLSALFLYKTSALFREAFFSLMTPPEQIPNNIKELKDQIKTALNKLKPKVDELLIKKTGYENLEKNIHYILHKIHNSLSLDDAKADIGKLKIIEKPGELYSDYWNSIKKACIELVISNLVEISQPLLFEAINVEEKHALIDSIASIGGIVNNSGNNILNKNDIVEFSSVGGSAKLFEWMVSASVVEAMNQNPNIANCISEIHCNVKTLPNDSVSSQYDSEIDVVITTKFGTLIVLEAKTYDFSGDTAKSRESIAYKKSGPFASAIIVGPLIRSIVTEKEDGSREVPKYIPGKTRDQQQTAKQNGIEYCYLDEISAMLINRLSLNK